MAFGFKPIGMLSSAKNIPVHEYDITPAATAIFSGDPVIAATDGSITVAAATNPIIGIFAGVKYYDAQGVYHIKPNHDATATYTNIKALVYDDPDTIFEVLANADVTAANVGAQYDFVYAAGSTVNGNSGVTLGISTLGTTGGAFRIQSITGSVGANARVVSGVFAEHVLKGVVSGVGGV
jgi:hypothetical protein